ncbi:hypothetical protein AQUCO_09100063v1 [Aquilegia coerulea]|uniref:HMG-Y-related protein A n=1 Tax=Aquilegia coerulea TaxID=218851 RepID=A0A2G5C765_AQUCA|nr:hypothetical protein AQUCO_09100063v1 [Aquilegia coerulea]
MATEEVNKPPSLPPYSEMILAAIDSLDDKDGSNKSAISKYIESTYGDLPESHTTLITDSLNQMKDNGELVLVKNNYMRPNPNAPPKRGRGRPPKAKTAAAASASSTTPAAADPTAPPRGRGRPPKQRDPLSVTVAPLKVTTSGTGRGRGRPPKKDSGADKESTATATETETTTTVPMTGLPRPRGRPPKVKPQFAAVGCD